MKRFGLGLAMMAGIVCFSVFAHAQDSAPQEAPFIQEDKEFDDAFKAENGVDTPAKKSVHLNDSVPEAGTAPVAQPAPVSSTEEPRPAAPPASSALFSDDDEESPAPHVGETKPPVLPPDEKVIKRDEKQGIEYIQHPQAAKGLIIIEEDGTYVYRIKEVSTYSTTSTVRFGLTQPPSISSANNSSTFASMYGSGSLLTVMYDYEMQPFDHFSQFKLAAGAGIFTAHGNGQFLNPSTSFYGPGYPSVPPYPSAMESYTFIAIPLTAGLVYRFQYANRQWVAPYLGVGGTYYGLAEIRNDGKSTNAVGTAGGYASGGLLFNITAVDRQAAFTLNSEYGVNNLWLSLELRAIQTVNKDLNMSSNVFSVGFAADY